MSIDTYVQTSKMPISHRPAGTQRTDDAQRDQ